MFTTYKKTIITPNRMIPQLERRDFC